MVPVTRLHPLSAGATLPAVIAHLTADGVGACWVAARDRPERLWGLITDGDLRRALQSHGPETWSHLTAADLMTADPITVGADTLAVSAMERMERNRRKAIGGAAGGRRGASACSGCCACTIWCRPASPRAEALSSRGASPRRGRPAIPPPARRH